MKSSNIGGQAVMEGIMMRHGDVYSVAVRKPDKEIEIKIEDYKSVMKCEALLKLPILRGVFNFIDSLVVGTKCLMYSATFFEEEEEFEKRKTLTGEEKEREDAKKEKQDKILMTGTVIFSVLFSVYCVSDYIFIIRRERTHSFIIIFADPEDETAVWNGWISGDCMMSDIWRDDNNIAALQMISFAVDVHIYFTFKEKIDFIIIMGMFRSWSVVSIVIVVDFEFI